MVHYDLSHLSQNDDQAVVGPIQDDEALLLYSLIRCFRFRRILEIGGLNGYSATNFLKAVGARGVVFTVDTNPVPSQGVNHIIFQMDAREVGRSQLGPDSLDLVFFDCHDYLAQMEALEALKQDGLVTVRTVLVLHDTALHPSHVIPWAVEVEGGWMHQDVERRMVNALRSHGYEALNIQPRHDALDATMPARHGLSILTMNRPLVTADDAFTTSPGQSGELIMP